MTTPPGPRPATGRHPRHARRVTAEHVRERVSVRHLVDDPDQGEIPTDVVGRLLAFEGDTLILIDRKHRLHAIDASKVLASRPVPPHPKLPAEPDVGTREHPVVRQAARVALLDRDQRILLASFSPSPGETIWTAPGGGVDPDEDHAQAALREVREELGIHIDLGPWIWSRRATFTFRGVWIDQSERWFLARTDAVKVADTSPDPGMDAVRWWTLAELRETSERLAPAQLADHLAELLEDGPPVHPVDVGR